MAENEDYGQQHQMFTMNTVNEVENLKYSFDFLLKKIVDMEKTFADERELLSQIEGQGDVARRLETIESNVTKLLGESGRITTKVNSVSERFGAISSTVETLKGKTEELSGSFDTFRKDNNETFNKMSAFVTSIKDAALTPHQMITSLESRVTSVEDNIGTMNQSLGNVESIGYLVSKINELEEEIRRRNREMEDQRAITEQVTVLVQNLSQDLKNADDGTVHVETDPQIATTLAAMEKKYDKLHSLVESTVSMVNQIYSMSKTKDIRIGAENTSKSSIDKFKSDMEVVIHSEPSKTTQMDNESYDHISFGDDTSNLSEIKDLYQNIEKKRKNATKPIKTAKEPIPKKETKKVGEKSENKKTKNKPKKEKTEFTDEINSELENMMSAINNASGMIEEMPK